MAPLPGPLRGWGSARCGPEAGTGSQVHAQNPAGSHPHVCLALVGRAGFQACPRVRTWIRAVTCCPDVENLNNFSMRGPTFAMGRTDPRAPPAHVHLNWPGGGGERELA